MIKFKMTIPRDFSEQIRKAFETQLNTQIRTEGYAGVSANIDRDGGIKFFGPKSMIEKFASENPDHFPSNTTVKSGKIKAGVIVPEVITPPKIGSRVSRTKKPSRI
jgi:hypothetical protein